MYALGEAITTMRIESVTFNTEHIASCHFFITFNVYPIPYLFDVTIDEKTRANHSVQHSIGGVIRVAHHWWLHAIPAFRAACI